MGEARLKSGFVRRLWLARAHPPAANPMAGRRTVPGSMMHGGSGEASGRPDYRHWCQRGISRCDGSYLQDSVQSLWTVASANMISQYETTTP